MSDGAQKAKALTGYADLGDQPPRPMTPHHLQQVRDAVDPMGADDEGVRHRCAGVCGACVDEGHTVAAIDVRALLQHVDYLQAELDQVDAGVIDYFGEGDDADHPDHR